jgi:hypothetical protein
MLCHICLAVSVSVLAKGDYISLYRSVFYYHIYNIHYFTSDNMVMVLIIHKVKNCNKYSQFTKGYSRNDHTGGGGGTLIK